MIKSPKNTTPSQSAKPAATHFFNKGNGDNSASPAQEKPFFSFQPSSVQFKLSIGQPNDPYEKEADNMADKVVQRLAAPAPAAKVSPDIQTKCAACEKEETLQKSEEPEDKHELKDKIHKKPIFESNDDPPEKNGIQAKCAHCEGAASPDLETRLNDSAGKGAALPDTVNQSMSHAFGSDFSNVKIHTDQGAAQMNKELNAQAFTRGNDIYFDSGKYDPGSTGGRHLLAHELTHVVQQGATEDRSAARPAIQRMPDWLRSASNWVSDKAASAVDSAVGGAKWLGGEIAAGASAVKTAVEDSVTAIYDEIKGLINSGMDWLREKWASIQEFASAGFEAVKNAFTDIVGFIKSPIDVISNAIMNFDADSLELAWTKFSAIVMEVGDGFKAVADNLINRVTAIWDGIAGFASSLFDRISGITQNFLFKRLPDTLQKIVNDLVALARGLWDSIDEGWRKIFNKIKTWIDSAIDKIIQFTLRVTSFGIHVVVEGIREFGELVLFLKDLFTNPQKYLEKVAKMSVAALAGVENRFSGIVSGYFGNDKKSAQPSPVRGTIQKQPNPGATAPARSSASWGELGTGIWKMMGKKWDEFKANPMAVVVGLLLDLFIPMYGNIKDIIQLGKDIWKIVTGPLHADSLQDIWTSFLQLLDIPILIYHTVVSILMRSLMVPLIVASFIPHPLVKGIAAAVGYALLGEFVQVELLNIGHKLLLLKTGATTGEQKDEAYNRIADSFIALAMTAAIILIMLILHFIANVIKGVYNFIKGKVFSVETAPPEAKAPGEGKGGPGEGKEGSGEGKPAEPAGTPELKGEMGSVDGQRSVKVTEKGQIWVCASPCEQLRLKYEAQIRENPNFEQKIKALEEGYSDLSPEERTVRDGKIKQLEQELADAKFAQEGGVRAPKEVKWPPSPPQGDKPPITAPDAAEWRYQRYVYDKAQEGAKPKDILPPDEWMRRYFDPTAEGGRPGRPGGAAQVAAKKVLAGEGIAIVENVELGGRYPDGVDPRPNPLGGKSYFEVGKMLESGIPEARERVKIADEIKAMGKNDTVTFVDKENPANRTTYAKGSTPDNPTSRTFTPKKE